MRGPLRPLLLDTLTREAVEESESVPLETVESLIRDHLERRANLGYHLWGLLTLFLWMKRWDIQTGAGTKRAAPRFMQQPFPQRADRLLFAAAVFLGCIISPPSLMDDVDAVQAQIARNMLDSGDWVTARLDGVAYLEKSPLKYWMIAISFKIFGVHDWAARLPMALVAVCAVLADGAHRTPGRSPPRPDCMPGLALSTCIGLFLFTRILIPDVILTLTITLAMWAFLRALDADERRPRLWAAVMAASIGTGLLLKGLIAAVFPDGGRAALSGAYRDSCWIARPGSGCIHVRASLIALADRRAVARSRDAPESAVFLLDDAQRAGRVSRLLLVLLHQRACAAVS